MSPAKPKHTWSLITRMRLGLLLLFIPVVLLGSIYYLHMERTLRLEQQQNLIAATPNISIPCSNPIWRPSNASLRLFISR